MIVDGFGIHAKLVGRGPPGPADRPADGRLRRPAAGPVRGVRPAPLRLRPRPDGDADPLHRLPGRGRLLSPGTTPLARPALEPIFGLDSGPQRHALPGPDPALQPAPRRRHLEPASPAPSATSHLKLDRDDGDQFLGDLNFRMPPGFTGDLRGIAYCPEAAIAAAAAEPRPRRAGRARAARPSSQIGTTNVAAGPGSHPFHAVGKMYLAGPVQGRAALASSRSPRRWPGPTTTASSSSGSPSTSIR